MVEVLLCVLCLQVTSQSCGRTNQMSTNISTNSSTLKAISLRGPLPLPKMDPPPKPMRKWPPTSTLNHHPPSITPHKQQQPSVLRVHVQTSVLLYPPDHPLVHNQYYVFPSPLPSHDLTSLQVPVEISYVSRSILVDLQGYCKITNHIPS